MTDKIRAALVAYKEIANYMNDEVCPSYAGDCERADEALREYDARATPALPQGVEEWIADNWWCPIHNDEDCDCGNGFVPADALEAYLSGMEIVPVKPAPEMINAALPHAMRESDEEAVAGLAALAGALS